MTAYACFRWRNYNSAALDLTFKGTANSPIEIDLKQYLIQGANPPNMDVLNEKQFQGAFLLNFLAITPPANGRLQPGSTGTGWRYYPNKDFVGIDSFTYVFSNGTQNSNVATVTLTVKPGLSGSILVFKAVDKPYWQVLGSHKIPTAAEIAAATPPTPPTIPPPPLVFGTNGTYAMITYTWIRKYPIKTFENGEPYIYEQYTNISSSTLQFDPNTQQPTVKDLNPSTDWYKSVWPDPSLSGYLPNSLQPYIQPAGPFPFILRIDFYDSPQFENILDPDTHAVIGVVFTHYATHDNVEIDVVSDKGIDWYKNGQVVLLTNSSPYYPFAPAYP
jgi:hypothetical protein